MNTTLKLAIPKEVIERFASKRGLRYPEAHLLFVDVQEFLDRANLHQSTPSKRVDEAWHEFILHTRLYEAFCRARYGRFIHHVPTSPLTCKGSEEETECKGEERCSSAMLQTRANVASCEGDSGGDGGYERCSSDCRPE